MAVPKRVVASNSLNDKFFKSKVLGFLVLLASGPLGLTFFLCGAG